MTDDTPTASNVRLVARGYRGDRMQPPEADELLIRCPVCGVDTDAYAHIHDPERATCYGIGDGEHEVLLP